MGGSTTNQFLICFFSKKIHRHRGGTLLAVSMAALNFVNSTEAAIALGRFEGVGLVGNPQGRFGCF